MVEIKSLDDVERDKAERQREDMKKKIVTDVNDVWGNLLKRRKEDKAKRKKERKWWTKIIIALLILGTLLLVINFVLGNIWLLKFFVKDLFHLK